MLGWTMAFRDGTGNWRRAALGVALALLPAVALSGAARAETFQAFVAGLWPEARAHGVSHTTFDNAFAGVTPDPDVIAKTASQAEFRKTVGEYLATAVSEKRIALGREKYKQYEAWLAKAEERFGVDRYVIMGVWGLETKFGTHMGDDYVIRSLATLAAAHYRGSYLPSGTDQGAGHSTGRRHRSCPYDRILGGAPWARRNSCHRIFKPYAVDFDGDGRRDIWTDVPDAIGSTANFLKKHGWIAGETWGYEVILPEGFEGAGDAGHYVGFAEWADRGIRRADGGDMPRTGRARCCVRPARTAPPSGDAQFQDHQALQQLDLLCARCRIARRPIAGWGAVEGNMACRCTILRTRPFVTGA